MNRPLQDSSLPDGTVVRVDAKTAWALGLLQTLAERLAHGYIDAMHVTWTGPENTESGIGEHSAMYYNKSEALLSVSKILQSQSKRLSEIASLWDGNAPPASRSLREQ